MKFNDGHIPERIDTDRLHLRDLADSDVAELFRLRSDPSVNRYIDRQPPVDEDAVREWVGKTVDNVAAGDCLYKAICLSPANAVVGTICLWNYREEDRSAEIGFEVSPGHWGNGYAAEALISLVKACSGMRRLDILEAYTQKDNTASRKLLEKCGFVFDRMEMEENSTGNGKMELCIYRLLLPSCGEFRNNA